MKRDVLLLDVTEMSGQNVCIAGIDLKTRQQVRLSSPQPTRTTVRTLGSIAPGDTLNTEWKRDRRITRPHVEDGRWDRNTARKTGAMTFDEIVALLDGFAFDSVDEAFGAPMLTGKNGNHAWRPETGERSLATVRTRGLRFIQDDDRVRASIRDAASTPWSGIPFQDLAAKLHSTSCHSCPSAYLANLRADFASSDCLVRVGLTRPYSAEDGEAACWLQMTNVFARPRSHFV